MSVSTADVLNGLKRWGRHATSFQILEPGYTYWVDPETSGLVAYVRCGSYRVAAGAPIGPTEDLGQIAGRFIQDAVSTGEIALFLQTDETFVDQLRQTTPERHVDSVPIGAQPEWDPLTYTTEGPARRGLRAQLNRARNKDVQIQAIEASNFEDTKSALMAQVEVVLQRWLRGRQMSPMSFLVDLQPFLFAKERRFYVAFHEGRAVAFLVAVPVYGRQGWFFEDIIRIPEAPNGTVELLIDTAMRDAASRGDRYVTLGLAPLADIPEGPGPHPKLRAAFRAGYQRLGPLYRFSGIHTFKNRMMPDIWRPQLLVQSPGNIGIASIHAVLRAFAGGGIIAFGVESLRRWLTLISSRAWARLLLLLVGLLIPWTVMLALVDGEQWFGDTSIQHAWVAFDIMMAAGLSALAWLVYRDHPGVKTMASCLTGATATDFIVTTVQAFNLHHGVSGWEALFVLAGMSGPLFASLILGALVWARSAPNAP